MLVDMIDHSEMFKVGSQKGCCSSGLESSMSGVRIEQNSYEMPPRDGFTICSTILPGLCGAPASIRCA